MTVLTSPGHVREFLTVAEVAAELACSEPTVRRRILDGSAPGGAARWSGLRCSDSEKRIRDVLTQATKGAPPHEL